MNANTRRWSLVAVGALIVLATAAWWHSREDGSGGTQEPGAQARPAPPTVPEPVPVPSDGIDLPRGAIPDDTRRPTGPR